jgi:DNA (cytosine-5)-methyltransferase 1
MATHVSNPCYSQSASKQKKANICQVSGGGGSTRGAKEAGLAVRYAMDGSDFCIETLRRNFPEAEIYHDWSDKFATLEEDLRVDIGHLSPPCQMWSVAKRWLGKNDEMNLASLFSVFGLVKKMMPRLVTLEQTFGITAPKFEAPFNSLVHAFTSLGYSVCWQIVRLQTLGLPQSRKRLIMIAAGCVQPTPFITQNYMH